MFVPPSSRVQIEDKGSELRITIPPRRNAVTIVTWLFLTGWLVAWCIGELLVGGTVFAGVLSRLPVHAPAITRFLAQAPGLHGAGLIFTSGLLIAWTAGSILTLTFWLRLMWGREVVTVDSSRLGTLYRPLGRLREYSAPDISNMRASTEVVQSRLSWAMNRRLGGGTTQNMAQRLFFGSGGITFTYGGQQRSFGIALDSAEAEQIVSAIGQRYKWMVPQKTPGDENA